MANPKLTHKTRQLSNLIKSYHKLKTTFSTTGTCLQLCSTFSLNDWHPFSCPHACMLSLANSSRAALPRQTSFCWTHIVRCQILSELRFRHRRNGLVRLLVSDPGRCMLCRADAAFVHNTKTADSGGRKTGEKPAKAAKNTKAKERPKGRKGKGGRRQDIGALQHHSASSRHTLNSSLSFRRKSKLKVELPRGKRRDHKRARSATTPGRAAPVGRVGGSLSFKYYGVIAVCCSGSW